MTQHNDNDEYITLNNMTLNVWHNLTLPSGWVRLVQHGWPNQGSYRSSVAKFH